MSRRNDHLPPHDIEAEQSVLGSVLIDRDAIIRLAPVLKPGDFFQASHSTIYSAMLDLYWRRVPTDLVTLVSELDRNRKLEQAGGESYIAELIAATPTSVHASYYADIVRQHAIRRALIQAGQEIVRHAYDLAAELPESIGGCEIALGDAVRGYSRERVESIDRLVDDYMARIDGPAPKRIYSGMHQLDDVLQGVTGGDIIVVGARPSFGKSAFAMQWAVNVAKRGQSVGVVSLEMRSLSLLYRMLAHETGIDSRKIAIGARAMNELEREWVVEAGDKLRDLPIYIDSHGGGRIEDLITSVRNLKSEKGLELLVVDYIGLMGSQKKHSGRVQEVGYVSRSLKVLAMELDIPVLVLAQLNRSLMSRSDPTPILSDLRETGDIEQDADIVIFIHRPGMFEGSSINRSLAEIIVAKHRNGSLGRVQMHYEDYTTTFRDTARDVRRAA